MGQDINAQIVDDIKSWQDIETWKSAGTKHAPTLNATEQIVDQHLMQLRRRSEINPGHSFLLSKDEYTKDPLFQLLRSMPKGALLHTHSVATTSFETLYSCAIHDELLHVYLGQKADLIKDMIPENEREDIVYGTLDYQIHGSCDAPGWRPLSKVPVEQIADWFRVHENVARQHRWAEFNEIWMRVRKVAHSVNMWFGHGDHGLLWKMLEEQYESGIRYFLLKKIISLPYYDYSSGSIREISLHDVVRMFGEVVERFKTKYPKFIGAKIVFSSLKFESLETVGKYANMFLDLTRDYPNYVDAFDMVGHEDTLKPLSYYFPALIPAIDRARKEKIPLKFALHAGETIEAESLQLYEALALGTSRLGHGFALIKHPHLMEICKERGTIIECCPLSNQALGYIPDVRNHPAHALYRHGLKVTVSFDDPGMFNYHDVTYDWLAIVISWSLSLGDCYNLARNSLEAVDPALLPQAVAQFEADWSVWVDELAKNIS